MFYDLINWGITAQSSMNTLTAEIRSSALQTQSIQDLICDKPNRKPVAFCQKRHGAKREYRVKGMGIGYQVESGSAATQCSYCGHALFWAERYEEIIKPEPESDSEGRFRNVRGASGGGGAEAAGAARPDAAGAGIRKARKISCHARRRHRPKARSVSLSSGSDAR